MKKRIQHTGYYLTGDPEEADHKFHYSAAIESNSRDIINIYSAETQKSYLVF